VDSGRGRTPLGRPAGRVTAGIPGTSDPLRGGVAVVGSLNLDFTLLSHRLPTPGETVLGTSLHQGYGGKGANQASAAARAGVATFIVGAVGDDAQGAEVRLELDRAGVRTEFLQSVPAQATGVAMIMLDAAGQNQIAVAPGANSHLDPDHVRLALEAIGRQIESRLVVLVSLEVRDEPVAAAVEVARAHGWMLVINPAPFRQLPADILLHVDFLTPNEVEASSMLGEFAPDDWAALDRSAIEQLLARSAFAGTVVTLGARGAVLLTKDHWHHVPAPPVAVVDSTGAGDAFNGAFAAGLAGGATPVESVKKGVLAGSLATTWLGAHDSATGGMDATRLNAEGADPVADKMTVQLGDNA